MGWYANFKKSAQVEGEAAPSQREARYRGIMLYEVRVPASEDKKAEQAAAYQAAGELYTRVFRAVGDEVLSYDFPEFYA